MTVEKMYSVEEAAAIIGIHPVTLRKWLPLGKVRGVKVGRVWRIPESALEEMAKSGTQNEE